MKELKYLVEVFLGLAVWLKVLLYLLLGGIVVAIAGYWGPIPALIAAVVVLLIGLLIIFLAFLSAWVRKRKEAELRGELDAAAAGKRVMDPGLSRRLDRLRASFHGGLAKFQLAGKHIDEMPLYLLLGEASSGKSAAIRTSGIELPQNLHDPDQGLSPTTDLAWWFTNYAVLLEAGGPVIFRECGKRSTPDWDALGDLLKNRQAPCPVNGVVIAIPAASLLEDPAEEVDRKAGILARHLDTLRHKLGLKFPVFLLVTKCDQIAGFASFFSRLPDEASRRQMFGWSNPAAPEAPLRPELIEEYFRTMEERLRRMRQAHLLDPVPSRAGVRRADEVDSLFDFPGRLRRLLPNTLRYVESLFLPGAWSSRPLFLRGVYFTAAAMPGSPVATGVEPGGEVPNRHPELPSNSLFLRDVLLDKIFREDALVTSAGTGARERLVRGLALFFCGVLFLAGLFLWMLPGYSNLLNLQVPQVGLWNRATNGWENGQWFPIVVPAGNSATEFEYRGGEPIAIPLDVRIGRNEEAVTALESELKEGRSFSLVQYHQTLVQAAGQKLRAPWIFTPSAWISPDLNRRRFEAQRTIFEASVISPLLDATRKKMSSPDPGSRAGKGPVSQARLEAILAHEAVALSELVRIEAAVLAAKHGKSPVSPGYSFLEALLEYVVDQEPDPRLVAVMNWTYDENPVGVREWAPQWASGGNSLAKNTAIAAGVGRLVTYAENRLKALSSDFHVLQGLAKATSTYSEAEIALFKATSIKQDPPESEPLVASALQSLEAAKIALDEEIGRVRDLGLFEAGPETLMGALSNLTDGEESHLGQVRVIMEIIDKTLPAPAKPTPTPKPGITVAVPPAAVVDTHTYKLFLQIQKELSGISNSIRQKLAQNVTDELRKSFTDLDTKILNSYEGQPAYLWRWSGYQQSLSAGQSHWFNPDMYLVGSRWSEFAKVKASVDEFKKSFAAYSGPDAPAFAEAISYFLNRVETVQAGRFISNWLQQAQAALLRVARFPLVWPPGSEAEALSVSQLDAARQLFEAVNGDVAQQQLELFPAAAVNPAKDFAKQIAPLSVVFPALLRADGTPTEFTANLYNGLAQKQLSGPDFNPSPLPSPSPTPRPPSALSKLFFGLGAPPPPQPDPGTTVDTNQWNAVSVAGNVPSAIFPLNATSDVKLGSFAINAPLSFRVYRSLTSQDGSQIVSGGNNWSALRLIAALGGKPIGSGTDWQVPLKPNEPVEVWIRFTFERPLPPAPWPTIDTLGLRQTPTAASP